jgi:hypothetical protein
MTATATPRAAAPRWPATFERSLLLLVVLLSAASVAAGLVGLFGVYAVRSSGVTVSATALGATATGGSADVYVRFLVGDKALVATAASPLWTPRHGTRVAVAYDVDDPQSSVRIVDSRVGGGYLVGLIGVLAGGVGLVAAYRRARRREPA